MMVKRQVASDKAEFSSFSHDLIKCWNFKTAFDLFPFNRPQAARPQPVALSRLPSFEIYSQKISFISPDGSYLLRIKIVPGSSSESSNKRFA
ncbi:MAG: hypothetical protein PHU81_08455 [Acidobacteriota bacterium]|nr:hypothetical protein [Acidobacteriota bacterium]